MQLALAKLMSHEFQTVVGIVVVVMVVVVVVVVRSHLVRLPSLHCLSAWQT
jgi:hypothetical protein